MPSTCAACGSRSVCLAVHLLLGRCDGETACSCPEAGDVRKRWEKEVDDLYTTHANSYPEEVAEYLTAPPRSLARDGPQVGRHGLTRSNRVSVTIIFWSAPPTVHPQALVRLTE